MLSALILAAAACTSLPRISGIDTTFAPQGDSVSTDVVDGEQIYFTASTKDGERITYTGGPNIGGMMMGSYLTCASCHAPDARGGLHTMHMTIMDAPDIRHEALVSEEEEHGEGEGDEHGHYEFEDFRRAVMDGEHPDGDPLSDEMPRWNISEGDLEHLFAFLQSLP